jgi:FixJ family two-component response regulator
MSARASKVYVVDDNPAILKALARLLRSAGYEPEVFGSARAFMEKYQADIPGCLVLDLSMPGITGLELQRWLMASSSPLPVIFLSGRGDIPAAVQAMKDGALDFLMKPVDDEALLQAIERAQLRDGKARRDRAEASALLAKLATLTPREREVFELVVAGKLNKQIAAELGTVEKTIKVHRGRVMEKMGVESLAELARAAERLGIGRSRISTPQSHQTADFIPSQASTPAESP